MYEELNTMLVDIFNQVLKVEALSVSFLATEKLTLSEVHTMDAIGTEKTCPMSLVAEQLGVTISTLTIAVNKLTGKGFVTRARGESDRRVVYISLTDSGKRVVRAHRLFHQRLVHAIADGLTEEKRQLLFSMLQQILSVLSHQKTVEHIAAGISPLIPDHQGL